MSETYETVVQDRDRLRTTLQRIMQVLGPDVPTDVDYTNPDNAQGLIAEQQMALSILREAGIAYMPRKAREGS